MFDPTAFDNMKVVIEGSIYDLDLMGRIKICDRNDILNMAKMSRLFNIRFRLPEVGGIPASANFVMESGLSNLAAELLPGASKLRPGCQISLEFILNDPTDFNDYQAIEIIFKEIWGSSRKISQLVQFNPINSTQKNIVITIDFERNIGEEQIDDLVAMIDVMVQTLVKLDQL